MGNKCIKSIEENIEEFEIPKLRYHAPVKLTQTEKDIPENIVWNETISFVPPVESGRVIKIYDGDTITIASKLPMPNSPIYRFSVRLQGIDTPEIKSRSRTEKHIAKLARDSLKKRIHGKWITLENVQLEKYGRILAEVWYEGDCINDWMIEKRFAVKYDGGKKKTPKNWRKYYNNKDDK